MIGPVSRLVWTRASGDGQIPGVMIAPGIREAEEALAAEESLPLGSR
jgi:hypothetical protein